MTMRMATLAARLLRPETFEAMMAPAIADAQHESARQHWFALPAAFVLALLHDLRFDFRSAFGSWNIRHVWAPALAWPLAFVAFLIATEAAANVYMGTTTRYVARSSSTWYVVIAVPLLTSLPWLMAPAAFRFMRRSPDAHRQILAGTIIVSALTALTMFALYPMQSPRLSSQDIAIRQTAYAIQAALFVPLLALAGVALSYSRGWRVGAHLILMVAVQLGLLDLIDPQRWPMPLALGRSVVVLAAVVGVSLYLARRARGNGEPEPRLA